jgi:hypothetical protein
MIDPAPLAHEPSDAELARRIALLDLPPDDPRRCWEPFVRHVDHPTMLTTTLLQRWLGDRPVSTTDLLTKRDEHRQYRVVTLVTPFDGAAVPLCHASAIVELGLLPRWARDLLTQTEQPLARTLHRMGAVRDRARATVLEADPEAPGDAGLRIRGTFRLPHEGGRAVATVEEWFTGYVLALRRAETPVAEARDHRLDDLDHALVRLLRQRRALAADRTRLLRSPVNAALDGGADGGSNQRLQRQLVHIFGRGRGESLTSAITATDEHPIPEQRSS